ncbi:RNA polymerase sigma factor [Gryllotalpicola reticulitermitis]|uniref:RNA polymerase sigma factor n=1 Tax=Gryllotalpicola reticulitermitis TaxID=1184153 RepID=A0ABV8Q882_9MICO
MSGDRSGESDAALWLEVLSGTASSFAVVYERHRRQVFRKAYALTGDVTDAEDVLAIVFLEAWRKRTEVRIVDGSLLPWLYATAGFTAMNTERAKRRHRIALAKLPASVPAPDVAATVADTIDGLAEVRALIDALSHLRPKERIIVQLCLVDELSLVLAAAVLDLPVGTVKSRLHRAREKLQRLLKDSRGTRTTATYFREVTDEPGR